MSGVSNPFALLGGDESEDDSEDERAAAAVAVAAAGEPSPAAEAGGETDASKRAGKDPSAAGGLVAIAGAVCHIVCKVRAMEEEDGHWLVRAEMTEAFIQRSYWNGKQLCGRDRSVAPFLTFLGSQRFGYVVAEPPSVASDSDDDDDDDGEEEVGGEGDKKAAAAEETSVGDS
jgi:hypothetical protein